MPLEKKIITLFQPVVHTTTKTPFHNAVSPQLFQVRKLMMLPSSCKCVTSYKLWTFATTDHYHFSRHLHQLKESIQLLYYSMALLHKQTRYLLYNKHATLANVLLMKESCLKSQEKIRIDLWLSLFLLLQWKTKEHMCYHWAYYTHKSHIQAQTQIWQIISPQMSSYILPADKETIFGQHPKLLLN